MIMKYVCFVLVLLWDSTLALNNEIPISDDVQFYHFNRQNPNESRELKTGEPLSKDIDPSLPWKFFIHGWTTSPAVSPWFHTGKAEYFKRADYNVVFVDWSKPANLSYIASCLTSKLTGKFVANFIIHLTKNNVSLENIHLLGHSLGSHMAGFTGKNVFSLVKNKIGRLTALDPAGPLFDFSPLYQKIVLTRFPETERLAKDDATFVDVIHTDAEHYGMVSSVGHIDIFPNGGKMYQPGCETTGDENCSHARSTHFYVESINSLNFIATQCSSYKNYTDGFCKNNEKVIFGEDINQSARGDFYLITNAAPPYAQGGPEQRNQS